MTFAAKFAAITPGVFMRGTILLVMTGALCFAVAAIWSLRPIQPDDMLLIAGAAIFGAGTGAAFRVFAAVADKRDFEKNR